MKPTSLLEVTSGVRFLAYSYIGRIINLWINALDEESLMNAIFRSLVCPDFNVTRVAIVTIDGDAPVYMQGVGEAPEVFDHKAVMEVSDGNSLLLKNIVDGYSAFIRHNRYVFCFDNSHQSQRFSVDDLSILSELTMVLYGILYSKIEARADHEKATTDYLTKLGNRYKLAEVLDELAAASEVKMVTIAIIDLDHFKQVNDRYSHDAGDLVLALVATVLENFAESVKGHAIRVGGEEFMVIFSDHPDSRSALEELRFQVESTRTGWEGGEIGVTISCGFDIWDKGSAAADALFAAKRQADKAVYHAKENGRNLVVAWSDMK